MQVSYTWGQKSRAGIETAGLDQHAAYTWLQPTLEGIQQAQDER